MLDKHFEDVIGSTLAILGTHEVAMFKGQSSPTLFRTALDAGDLDQPLLAALLRRWRRRYQAPESDWTDIALFRSLNMAYHASLLSDLDNSMSGGLSITAPVNFGTIF